MSYKHPNLPGLLIELAYRITGQYGWPQYMASALLSAAAVYFVYLLGRDMAGPTRGAAGALLLTGCYYFTWPTPELNHNIAQLPVWAAVALLLWRAAQHDRPIYWLLLGAVAGLGLYAKMSTLLILAAGGLWVLLDPLARSRLRGIWPWLGLAVFALLATPFALRLYDQTSSVVSFIGESGSGGGGPLSFLLAQLANLVPMLVVAGVAMFMRKRDSVLQGDPSANGDLARQRRYLVILIGLPLLVALAAGLVTGVKDMWGTPVLNLVGLAIVLAWPQRVDAVAFHRIAIGALALVLLAPTLFAVRFLVHEQVSATPLRTHWPQAEISDRLVARWREATGASLRIVAGNEWVAGLVALSAQPRASVYSDLSPHISPWISPERTARDGMLVVWTGESPPDYAEPWLPGNVSGSETLPWSAAVTARPIVIGYVIVPPGAASPFPYGPEDL